MPAKSTNDFMNMISTQDVIIRNQNHHRLVGTEVQTD